MIKTGKKYVITTDSWFFAPDGYQYRSAWGKCILKKTEDVFNFKPSRPSTNWFVQVGEDDKSIIIAGCQIHYAIECDLKPFIQEGFYESNNREHPFNRIYIAQ